MKRLGLLTLLVIFALTFGLNACGKKGGDDDDSTGFKLRSEGEYVLNFMMWGDSEEKSAVYEVLESFQAIHTNIGIKVIHTDSLSFADKLQTMFAGGDAPDVFYMYLEDFFGYASKGLLYPLDDYVEEPEYDLDDFYSELVNAFRYGGNLYGIPKDWTDFVLYYNMDLFDAAGLDYPNETWTWEDFREAAIALTVDEDDDGKADQFGFLVEKWANWYYNWILQNGGKIFDESGNWVFADAAYINKNAEALQFLSDLINVDGAAPDVMASLQLGSQQAFMTEQAAMCMYGRWVELNFKDIKDFRWDYTVLPHKEQRATVVNPVALSMSKDTMYPDQAWLLLDYLTSFEGQIFTAEGGIAVPSRISVVESDHYLEAPDVTKFQPHLKMDSADEDPFIIQMESSSFAPNHPNWIEIRQKLDEQLEAVFLGTKDAKSVILSLDGMVRNIMQDTGEEVVEIVGDEE